MSRFADRVRGSQRLALAAALLLVASAAGARPEPLPSWRDGAARARLVDFVRRVTTEGGPDYVPPADRIAVFDHDGTLWAEQPGYFQLLFAIDRVKALAPHHPEWRDRPPFRAALDGDLSALAATGESGVVELIMATHAGMTSEEFAQTVAGWLATARHPTLGRPYTDLVYLPMLELLAYLRANGFQTYIVSGGGIEFVRVFSEARYGVPPQQVVGSSVRTVYQVRDGTPAIVRLGEIDFINDRAGKPVGINTFIGKRPIAAFGNSDGDFEMLEWTTSGPGARLGMLVHHDDAAREFAYDRDSPVGRLARGLDEAPARGWTIVSMKDDWKTVYPADGARAASER